MSTPDGLVNPAKRVDSDRCPRCGGAFHCGVADAAPCPCGTVPLDEARLAALRHRYQGCLCLACLQAVAAGAEL